MCFFFDELNILEFFLRLLLFFFFYEGIYFVVRKWVEEKMGMDLLRLMMWVFCNGGELVWGEFVMGWNLLSVMKIVYSV